MISFARALVLLAGFVALAGCLPRTPPAPATRQFTFAWPFVAGDSMAPRGGTTSGAGVVLDVAPSPAYQAIQTAGLPARERDRRAILAMAGVFRASFDFLEVIDLLAPYIPTRPYQSWGTEWVYVLADEPTFVSLQHLLVMSVRTPDGRVEGPFVTKHWRQDWRWEDRDLLVYRGQNVWEHERLTAAQARGTWTQAVFQVDDSPRYESFGRWEHLGNLSSWRSGTTWRPLPRREFSVRDDYQVLIGTNRHTITPTGWVQEEDNYKVALVAPGQRRDPDPVLGKETGLNRYERLRDFDRSAGARYRERTGAFWTMVREAWAHVARERARIVLRAPADQGQLFVPLFTYAEQLHEGAALDEAAMRAFVQATVRGYLVDGPVPAP